MAGGMELHFFRPLKFQISEFLRKFTDLLQISASEKYFPGSGEWQFHTPPIHTPPKCRKN